MARYFFHIRDGDTLIEDTEGIDVPDLEAAREEAVEAAREIVAERALEGKASEGQVFEIWSHGQMVAAVPFQDGIGDTTRLR